MAGLKPAEAVLKKAALSYPEAWEDFPWGDRVFKVRKKIFLFLAVDSEKLSMAVKLPASSPASLMLPFTKPTAYGLGKAGWVSVSFPAGRKPPVELFLEWIDESYRAVAPRTLVRKLGAVPEPPPARKSKPRPKS